MHERGKQINGPYIDQSARETTTLNVENRTSKWRAHRACPYWDLLVATVLSTKFATRFATKGAAATRHYGGARRDLSMGEPDGTCPQGSVGTCARGGPRGGPRDLSLGRAGVGGYVALRGNAFIGGEWVSW